MSFPFTQVIQYQLHWRTEVTDKSEAWFALQLLGGPDSKTWTQDAYNVQEAKLWEIYVANKDFQNARVALNEAFEIPGFPGIYQSSQILAPPKDLKLLAVQPTLSLAFFVRDLLLHLIQDTPEWLRNYLLTARGIVSDELHRAEDIVLQETCPEIRKKYVQQFTTALCHITEGSILRVRVRKWLQERPTVVPSQVERFLCHILDEFNVSKIYTLCDPCVDCKHVENEVSLFYNRSPVDIRILGQSFGISIPHLDLLSLGISQLEKYWFGQLLTFQSALLAPEEKIGEVMLESDRLRSVPTLPSSPTLSTLPSSPTLSTLPSSPTLPTSSSSVVFNPDSFLNEDLQPSIAVTPKKCKRKRTTEPPVAKKKKRKTKLHPKAFQLRPTWFVAESVFSPKTNTFENTCRKYILEYLKEHPGWHSLRTIYPAMEPSLKSIHKGSYSPMKRVYVALTHLRLRFKHENKPVTFPSVAVRKEGKRPEELCLVYEWPLKQADPKAREKVDVFE